MQSRIERQWIFHRDLILGDFFIQIVRLGESGHKAFWKENHVTLNSRILC